MDRFPFKYSIDEELALVAPTHVQSVAEELFRLLDSDREHLRPFLSFVDTTQTVEDELAFIKSQLNGQAEGTDYLLLITYRKQLVGTINYHFVSASNQRAEIGYWLHSAYNGQGIMTRSVKAMLAIGFETLDFNRIDLYADIENHASNAVAKRAGFTHVAVQPAQVKLYDSFRDMNQYVMLKSDYEAMKLN